MISEGHINARRYPLVVLWQEAQIARERVNGRIVTEAVLMDHIISAHMATGKSARKNLNELLEKIQNGR